MRKTLPVSYITTIKPKEYLVQGLSHCGAYSVKTILSAYGKDNKKYPEDYHTHWFNRITGAGFSKNYYVNILKSFGLQAKFKNVRGLSKSEKVYLLKFLLSNNTPVMLTIGNGYSSNGEYSPLRAAIQGHWITLWGYDDEKQVFYVYDSCVKITNYDKNIPIGNTKRSYNEIMRDWKGSINTKLLFSGEYGYIEINP